MRLIYIIKVPARARKSVTSPMTSVMSVDSQTDPVPNFAPSSQLPGLLSS
jgi:hypothetical protein